MNRLILGLSLIAITPVAFADSQSPYAGQETRAIKALSEAEVEGYLEGKGLGFAKAAELNHYPGPAHVLELAHQLGLSEQQIAQTDHIYARMKQQATALGRSLVDREFALDKAFADGSVQSDSLKALVAEIGDLEAQIRYVHLQAHLDQRGVLSREQLQQYDGLRGYTADGGEAHQHTH